MKLEISKDTSQLLVPTTPWDFTNPPMDVGELAHDMLTIMNEHKGFGLAGNQVGVPYSVFVMRGEPENFFFINPRIVNLSGELVNDWEGCLSFKGFGVKQNRYLEARIRFSAPDGQTYTKQFKGLTARVVQHEMDHLNGAVWWSGVSKLKFDMAKKKALSRGWEYVKDLTYKGV
jgi:peptide deformylase